MLPPQSTCLVDSSGDFVVLKGLKKEGIEFDRILAEGDKVLGCLRRAQKKKPVIATSTVLRRILQTISAILPGCLILLLDDNGND